MPNRRMLPPADGKRGTIKINGRTYTASLGAYLDVPAFDARAMQANGWTPAASEADVGATSLRPATPHRGAVFLDTTLSAFITFDGVNWRNVLTGAVA